jgi:hypothetical protein
MEAAPRRKEIIAVRDFVQAREGVSTGRELAPRARKMVLPVCECSLVMVHIG